MATVTMTTVEIAEVGKAAAISGAVKTTFLKKSLPGKLKMYECADDGGIVKGTLVINAAYSVSQIVVTYA